jgi:LAO/AO transport system ATPase
MLDALLAGLRAKDRRALARLITLAARGEYLDAIRASLSQQQGGDAPRSPAHVVAFTGSGGVGKSSLVGKLIEQFRERGKSVAVLACDPESPLTGGALLGDRFRMPARPDDVGVYIRSLAAQSGRQAVADHLDTIVCLCESFGFDIVLIETVGAGQGDTAVRSVADAVILLLQPETGDDLQWEKAGVLEVADAVVVHKADLPGADRTVAQIQSMLALSTARAVPVLAGSSRTGAGLAELVEFIETVSKRSRSEEDARRELLRLAQQELALRFARADVDGIVNDWLAGRLSQAEAVKRAVRVLSEPDA